MNTMDSTALSKPRVASRWSALSPDTQAKLTTRFQYILNDVNAAWWNDRSLGREEKEAYWRSIQVKSELDFNKRQRGN